MSNKTASVITRVTPETKEAAEKVLEELGMSMATAIEIYLKQIAIQGRIPFDICLGVKKYTNAPGDRCYLNEDLQYGRNTSEDQMVPGIKDEDLQKIFQKGIEEDLQATMKEGIPVPRYDAEKKLVYLEYADGRKEYKK